MPNDELFDLAFSFVTSIQVYLNWELSPFSPTDTIATDTFYLSYTNQATSETVLVNTGKVMNQLLWLNPNSTYTMFVYSINSLDEQSFNSNSVFVQTGDGLTNTLRANGYLRVFNTTDLTKTTILDADGVVSVSAAIDGIATAEPTSVAVFTPTSPKPFYQLYKIDPKGQLFGFTPCTENRFKTRVIIS